MASRKVEINQVLHEFAEFTRSVEQLPLADLLLLEQALKNTNTFADIAPEYIRLKGEQYDNTMCE